MKVTTQELRQAVSAVLDHLDQAGQTSFEIMEDYYWDVPAPSRYDPTSTPQTLTLGQLTDDWAEVQGIVSRQRTSVGYALVWLAAVLRSVGEKAVG